jgi:tetratricopeptide (TPR) repeat protein
MKKSFYFLFLLVFTFTGYSQSAIDYFNNGNEKAKLKDYSGAIADYSQAIMKKPGYSEAYYKRGLSNMEMKHNGKAILDFNKAIELKPDYAEAYMYRGITKIEILRDCRLDEFYYLRNDFLMELHFATNAHINWTFFLPVNKIIEFEQKDTTGRLVREYVSAIKINPDDAKGYFDRGIVKLKVKDCDSGISDILKAFEIEPRYKDSLSIYPDYNEAIADFSKAIELKPNYTEAYYKRAIANIKSGNEEACDDLAKAEELGDKRASDLIKQYCQ